ncbi:MAG: glycosyltransferase family 39 protein, partial [Candidatus Altiarchaeota archaeon]
ANLRIGRIYYLPGHPPLIRTIAALPLLTLTLKYEEEEHNDSISMDFVDIHFKGLGFLDQNTPDGKDRLILYYSRTMIMLLSVLMGVIVFVWARQLYGVKAGIFAVFLFSFEPNLIAHSGLVTTDAGVSFFILATFYFLYRYVKTWKIPHLVACCILFGLSLLAKHTSFVVVPAIAALLFIGKSFSTGKNPGLKNVSRTITFTAASFLAVWMIAFTVVAASSGFHDLSVHKIELGKILPADVTLPLIVPQYYSKALDLVFSIGSEATHPNFLMGQHKSGVWWYLPLVAFMVKTPMPFILFFGLSLLFFFLGLRRNFRVDELFLLVPLFTVVFFFSFVSNKALALRYILSAFPFIIIFSSSIVNHALERRFLGKIVALLSVWYVLSAAGIAPHYIAYFNELVGGPMNGHKYLADSNLDWGQDNWLLDDYVAERNLSGYKASLFFRSGPYYKSPYGVVAGIPCEPENGTFIASASALAGVFASGTPHEFNCLAWLRQYEPSDNIGYSIFVYNITPSSIPKSGFDWDFLGFVVGKLRRDPVFDFKLRLRDARVYVQDESDSSDCIWNADRMQWVCSDLEWNTISWTRNSVGEKEVECIWAHPVDGKTTIIEFPKLPAGRELRVKAALVDSALGCLDDEEVELQVSVGGDAQDTLTASKNKTTTEKTIPLKEGLENNVTFRVSAKTAKCKHFCFDAVVY